MHHRLRSFRILAFTILGLCLLSVPAAASWFWIQSDWSGGAYESADMLDPEIEPGELVLQSDKDHLILAFDASAWDGVWCLQAWRGDLYIGACNFPNHEDFGDILIYDYAADAISLDIPVEEEGINVFKVRDDTLFSPGTDALGPVYIGNVYYNDGDGWVIKSTVPLAAHVYDLEVWDDRLWVTTGCYNTGDNPGVLYSSDDMGDTWTDELHISANPPGTLFRRLYGMGTWNGSLFVNSDFESPENKVVYEFNGETMITHEVEGPGDHSFGSFMEWGGKLAFLTRSILDFYDGQTWTWQVLPLWSANFSCRAMESYGGRFYIGGYEGAIASEDPESGAWVPVELAPSAGREIEDFTVLHGRLYAGTLHSGEVFVTPSALSGTLVSEPYAFGAAVCEGTVSWTALTPGAGTSLAFQVRSASSEALLAAAPFLGPDGSGETWYETPGDSLPAAHCGHQWFQYRVRMETDDERLAPVLEEFVLEVDNTGTGLPGDAWSSPRLAAWPNPFRSELRLSLSGGESGGVKIFDVSGRCVRDLGSVSGAKTLIWDGKDDGGASLSAGVYLLRYEDARGEASNRRVVLLR